MPPIYPLQQDDLGTNESEEPGTGVVKLEDDDIDMTDGPVCITLDEDVHTFHYMIAWMYTNTYSYDVLTAEEMFPGHPAPSPLLAHAKVYVMARKYTVKDLKGYATRKYGERLGVESVGEWTESVRFMILNKAFEGEMRNLVLGWAVESYRELVDDVKFKELCRFSGLFAFQVLNRVAKGVVGKFYLFPFPDLWDEVWAWWWDEVDADADLMCGR